MYALAALRLVCRAARDDFVDGRVTHLQLERHFSPSTPYSVRMARRLRRLARLVIRDMLCDERPAAVAAFLSALPGRGAALKELELDTLWCSGRIQVGELSAALGGLAALDALELAVTMHAPGDATQVLGALCAAAPPAARLALQLDCRGRSWGADEALAALVPLGRLERLAFEIEMPKAPGVLAQLFEPDTAAALTALRSLAVSCYGEPPPLRPASGSRAPWLSQLTELRVAGRGAFAFLSGALAPRALPLLEELSYDACVDERAPHAPATDLAALLAACEPAALRSLHAAGVRHNDVVRLAERLPALNGLDLSACAEGRFIRGYSYSDEEEGGDNGDDDGAARAAAAARDAAEYQALQAARLAPLTSLELSAAQWLLDDGARPAALFSAPWAAPLVELTIAGPGWLLETHHLRALRALSQLQHLRTLRVRDVVIEADQLQEAAAGGDGGWAAGWAPRLVALELKLIRAGMDALRELLRGVEWARLERIGIGTWFHEPDFEEELMAECLRALPAVRKVSLFEYGYLFEEKRCAPGSESPDCSQQAGLSEKLRARHTLSLCVTPKTLPRTSRADDRALAAPQPFSALIGRAPPPGACVNHRFPYIRGS